jgi:hypothetical protein
LRITLFAKGNLDVRDALHSLRAGNALRWNGINEILRERGSDTVVRLRHETCTRSDAVLAATGTAPAELCARNLPLEPYPPESQFSTALFDTAADAYVLSIQPDVMNPMFRHRRDGWLICPYRAVKWPAPDKAWLAEHFEPTPPIDAATSMQHLEQIAQRLRARSQAPVLVFNMSAAIPGDSVHSHEGLGDTLATRVRRFNLALIELSQRTGISVVDVDTVVAREGVGRAKLDALHFTADGARAVAAEVVRILDDLGCLAPAQPAWAERTG